MQSSGSSSSIVQADWQSTAEGEAFLQHLYNAKTTGRKLFGILERPSIFMNTEEVSYKLLFLGKNGVGKTSTVARLAGIGPLSTFSETSGIRVTDLYWPVKIWDKIILFKLQCWEAGSNSMKKFSHIQLVCKERVDIIVFVFTLSDAGTFSDLPSMINRIIKNDANRPAIMVIGTRFNPLTKVEVTKADIEDFESKFSLNISTITNNIVGHNEVNVVAPVLNSICEKLWLRDQQYILNQGITV